MPCERCIRRAWSTLISILATLCGTGRESCQGSPFFDASKIPDRGRGTLPIRSAPSAGHGPTSTPDTGSWQRRLRQWWTPASSLPSSLLAHLKDLDKERVANRRGSGYCAGGTPQDQGAMWQAPGTVVYIPARQATPCCPVVDNCGINQHPGIGRDNVPPLQH